MTNTVSCGCKIISDNLGAYKIEYCPKHGAAPLMYEALEAFDHYLSAPYPHNMKVKAYAVRLMEHALAKVGDKRCIKP